VNNLVVFSWQLSVELTHAQSIAHRRIDTIPSILLSMMFFGDGSARAAVTQVVAVRMIK
jgi:hypothetical protein